MNTHLNIGNYYADKSNYYNAIREYSDAIIIEKQTILGHGNVADVYSELGLNEIAMKQINIGIGKIESNIIERDVWDFKLYSTRARLYRRNEQFDLMLSDIEKCRILKKRPHYASFCTISNFLLQTNQIDKIETLITTFLQEIDEEDPNEIYFYKDIPDFRKYLHVFLAHLFEVMGDYQRAIQEINNVIKKNDKVLKYQYRLGQLIFNAGNLQTAEKHFEELSKKNKNLVPYKFLKFQDGIIINVSSNGKIGTVITKTFFKVWDIIEFRNDESNFSLCAGDLVSLKLEYFTSQGLIKGVAYNLNKINSIRQYKLKHNQTFHCIINFSSNINKDITSLKYVFVFYPTKFLVPYSFIDKHLTENMLTELESKGYLFLEVDFIIESQLVKIKELRLIEKNNKFSKIIIPGNQRNQSRTSFKKNSNKKECQVCQMNEWCGTDGCPLDPT